MSCAKRGSITGGLKDTIAPVLKVSFPENFNTNFKGKTIKLTFDEYIKLKNINKQLIISPPMSKLPEITPQTASKFINIKFNDTLLANTTYSLNFGESIQDNNEGNPYKQFKYVFSTGPIIDSLTLSGTINDAYNKKPAPFVSVMLYEVNDKFKDSIVYKEKPRYITSTLDSVKTFKLENLKPGKYLLIALKDENRNFKFDSKNEKIGFRKQYITLPNDSLFEIKLFKEQTEFKPFKPSQASGNRLLLPYEGKPNNLKVILKNGQTILPTIITQFPKKDSVQVWYNPIKTDSLNLETANNGSNSNFRFKIKDQKKDSIKISSESSKILPLREKLILSSSVPLIKFDQSKMQLKNKDSVEIAFTTEYDEWKQNIIFNFKKEPLEKYILKLFPGALIDYMDEKNDSLVLNYETKSTANYGNLRLKLENVKQFPIIVELTNSKGDIIASEYSESNTIIDFTAVEPTLFTLRVIYDVNKNKVWDSGNYLKKQQSEEVIYFPKEIDIRANWDVEQIFNLGN